MRKTRDRTRIYHLNAFQWAIEQIYQDNVEYPSKENFKELVSEYMSSIPQDSFAGFTINGCNFWYIYEIGPDKNGIANGNYRLSTCFENKDYIFDRAAQDRGGDNLRFEKWYWDEDTKFTEKFYINDISSWKTKVRLQEKVDAWSLDSLDNVTKKDIYHFMISIKYQESNLEVFEKEEKQVRDSRRRSDIASIMSAIMQSYLEYGEYPTKATLNQRILENIGKIPYDDKYNQTINGCTFGYKYFVWDSERWKNGEFKLSTCLEEDETVFKRETWFDTWVQYTDEFYIQSLR